MYKVVKAFTDLQDDGYLYKVGDEYPRAGIEISADRIAELESDANRQKTPLIAKVNGPAKKQSLDPATPAQPKKVEQETPQVEEKTKAVEKPARRKKKED